MAERVPNFDDRASPSGHGSIPGHLVVLAAAMHDPHFYRQLSAYGAMSNLFPRLRPSEHDNPHAPEDAGYCLDRTEAI